MADLPEQTVTSDEADKSSKTILTVGNLRSHVKNRSEVC
jgi:hypothetical protein